MRMESTVTREKGYAVISIEGDIRTADEVAEVKDIFSQQRSEGMKRIGLVFRSRTPVRAIWTGLAVLCNEYHVEFTYAGVVIAPEKMSEQLKNVCLAKEIGVCETEEELYTILSHNK
jgi:hypothetical protein